MPIDRKAKNNFRGDVPKCLVTPDPPTPTDLPQGDPHLYLPCMHQLSCSHLLSLSDCVQLTLHCMGLCRQWKTYKLDKGPKFALERKKPATELTQEMLAKGTWRTQEFKDYNFNALGQLPQGGHLHPLMKVRHCSFSSALRHCSQSLAAPRGPPAFADEGEALCL
eukprot:1126837-Pelagomonas_calceolata.AAC.3